MIVLNFKIWFLTKMIYLCNCALKYSDGADDQNEINEVVSMKNYFMQQHDKLIKR